MARITLYCSFFLAFFFPAWADSPANTNYAISITLDNNHMCGGSIIDNYHILTAAHCVIPFIQNPGMASQAVVVVGTNDLNSGGQAYRLAKLWANENYNPDDPSGRGPYDIGLIRLASPIQYGPTVQPIRLPTRNIAPNEDVTVAAWGATGRRQTVHNNLQKLHAKAMMPDTCQNHHQNMMRVANSEFCTLITYGTGLCNGDSGSGLLRNSDNTIVGLVSGGRPCAVG